MSYDATPLRSRLRSLAPLRVLVCGGRDYYDYATLSAFMDRYAANHVVGTIIHGAARGADTLAGRWAHEHGIVAESFPANWQLGKRAGPLRNSRMLREARPDVVIAFPGGRGTANMVEQAAMHDIPVVEAAMAKDRG